MCIGDGADNGNEIATMTNRNGGGNNGGDRRR